MREGNSSSNRKKVNFKATWNKFYEKYKDILKTDVQAVLQKNNEAWSSFFLSLKNKDSLPPFVRHIYHRGIGKITRKGS